MTTSNPLVNFFLRRLTVLNRRMAVFSLLFIVHIEIIAQSTTLSRNDNLYIHVKESEIEFVKSKTTSDSRVQLSESHLFELRDNDVTLYLKWINPLKYAFNFGGELVTDSRLELVERYLTDYVNTLPNITAPARPQGIGLQQNLINCSTIDGKDKVSQEFVRLYLAYKDDFDQNDDLCSLWNATAAVLELDITGELRTIQQDIKDMVGIDDFQNVNNTITVVDGHSNGFKDEINNIAGTLFFYNQYLVQLNNDDLNLAIDEFNRFYTSVQNEFKELQRLVNLANIYSEIVKLSSQDEADGFNGYFHIRNISLPKGKQFTSMIEVKTRTLEHDYTLTTSDESQKFTLTFQHYDFIKPSISTGAFYSSVKFSKFEAISQENGSFTVQKTDIDRSRLVTAAFLNFEINIGSQILSPIFQIGVDPTKEYPFILLGGGFLISNKFSLTGGVIWTWNQDLSSLKEGQIIQSSSALDEDLKYTLDETPPGWYVGLNYIF